MLDDEIGDVQEVDFQQLDLQLANIQSEKARSNVLRATSAGVFEEQDKVCWKG